MVGVGGSGGKEGEGGGLVGDKAKGVGGGVEGGGTINGNQQEAH